MNVRRLVLPALLVACGIFVYSLVPAAPEVLAPPQAPLALPVRGVMHVHTRRSDGTGTIEQIAAAAARVGLDFVVFTDHGTANRKPERPAYWSGVLCIDAVEISTDGGHVVALDLPEAPYPLGGESRDVIDDIRRLGGFSIAAHPDSAAADLEWTNWKAPFDGLEWLNIDSQWRDEPWPDLARALLTYPFSRVATLAALIDRPDSLLARWDALTAERRVVGVAATDAHARIALDPYRDRFALRAPGYEPVFRTVSISLPGVELSRNAADDARKVVDAIRGGRLYSTVDGFGGPVALELTATAGSARASFGGALPADGRIEFRAATNVPAGSRLVLLKNGSEVASSAAPALAYSAEGRGAYRIEIEWTGKSQPLPWVVSNPVYVGIPATAVDGGAVPLPGTSSTLYGDGSANGWQIEKNPRSEGTLDVVKTLGGSQLRLRFGLGGTRGEGPYVAAVKALPSNPDRFDRVSFTARAARPMRISVQLRAPDATRDRRWRRSIYLDEEARSFSVTFDEMTPVGASAGPLVAADLRDVLFVVDTVNTEPGSNGQVWIDEVTVAR